MEMITTLFADISKIKEPELAISVDNSIDCIVIG